MVPDLSKPRHCAFSSSFMSRTFFYQPQVKIRLAVLAATNCTLSQTFYSKQELSQPAYPLTVLNDKYTSFSQAEGQQIAQNTHTHRGYNQNLRNPRHMISNFKFKNTNDSSENECIISSINIILANNYISKQKLK